MKYIKIDKEKLEKEKETLQYKINNCKDTSPNRIIKLSLEQWINCIDWVLSIGEED